MIASDEFRDEVRRILEGSLTKVVDDVKVVFTDFHKELAVILEDAQQVGDWSEVLRVAQVLRRTAAKLNG